MLLYCAYCLSWFRSKIFINQTHNAHLSSKHFLISQLHRYSCIKHYASMKRWSPLNGFCSDGVQLSTVLLFLQSSFRKSTVGVSTRHRVGVTSIICLASHLASFIPITTNDCFSDIGFHNNIFLWDGVVYQPHAQPSSFTWAWNQLDKPKRGWIYPGVLWVYFVVMFKLDILSKIDAVTAAVLQDFSP